MFYWVSGVVRSALQLAVHVHAIPVGFHVALFFFLFFYLFFVLSDIRFVVLPDFKAAGGGFGVGRHGGNLLNGDPAAHG